MRVSKRGRVGLTPPDKIERSGIKKSPREETNELKNPFLPATRMDYKATFIFQSEERDFQIMANMC